MLTTVLNIVLVGLPVLAGLYSFWSSCKKDGFDQEKSFDLLIAGFLAGGVFVFAVYYIGTRQLPMGVADLNIFSFVFGFVGITILLANKWGWSVYRVLDNFASASALVLGFWLVLQSLAGRVRIVYLPIGVALFIVYYLLQKYRLTLLKSGFTFCLISALFCVSAGISSPKIVNLIFIGLLFTLTLTVFIFRVRRLYVGHKKIGSSPHTS